MLRKIKLYGDLADQVGHKEFEDIKVSNVAEAVSFLINNFPYLEKYMSDKYYKVIVNDEDIGQEELHDPIGKSDISFVPVISGSGGNFGKILLGVALIGLSFTPMGAGLFAGGPGLAGVGGTGLVGGMYAAGAYGSAALGLIGAGLVLSGVSEMLFPMPKQPEFSSEGDPRVSFSFSGTQQTSRAGTPVPIVYGEIFTGSVVISGGIDTEQVQV
jgi:predicted phage tail protein